MKNENLEALNNILGFGDVNANLIFFGIEEGGEWKDDENLLQKLKNLKGKKIISNEDLLDIGDKFNDSPVYSLIAKCTNLLPSEIGNRNSKVIVANLYPIAVKKISNDFPDYYKKIFGLKNRDEYKNLNYWVERKRDIQDFIKNKQRKTIICMGKTHWTIFKEVFSLPDNEPCKFSKPRGKSKREYHKYKIGSNDFYLVDHPSNSWLLKEHLEELLSL